MEDVFIVSACRTAIGGFGGVTKDVSLTDLGAAAISESLRRARVDQTHITEVVMGCVIQAGNDVCPARISALQSGLPDSIPAFTVNKACGSGMKATALAAQAIAIGDAELMVAGGMESMNRVPYALDRARTGYRLGHGELRDLLVNGLTCPITNVHMGVTAENVAERHGITRQEQDEYAAASYAKALAAQAAQKFSREIFALEIPQPRGAKISFDRDEDVRETPLETLAKLRAAFKKDGTVTAGNASNINDGAAALVLASGRYVKEHKLTPLARVMGTASAGLDPSVMGLGPARAVPKLMQKLGWRYDSVDLWELNEAFAAQALGVLRELPEIDRTCVNVHGGAIALGHPVGASGARILATLIYALADRGKRRGVGSLCIGTGMGIAMGIELCS
ncbi:MAG TPA: thiolase family protein [Polyangiales bacterium]|nr:thiolase family protein [Polyangiales bacterium]